MLDLGNGVRSTVGEGDEGGYGEFLRSFGPVETDIVRGRGFGEFGERVCWDGLRRAREVEEEKHYTESSEGPERPRSSE